MAILGPNGMPIEREADPTLTELSLSTLGVTWRNTHWYPPNPDTLLQNKGLDFSIYDAMLTDGTVKGAIYAKKKAVSGARFRLAPASKDPGDVRIRDYVQYVFDSMIGSPRKTIKDLLDATARGFAVLEKIWVEYDRGQWAGMTGYYKLAARDSKDFQFRLDEHGNLMELLNVTRAGSPITTLPLDKFVVFTNEERYGLPWGESDLRAAYKHWWTKDFLRKWRNVFMETFAMPTRVAKIPRDPYYDADKRTTILNTLKSIVNNTSIILPADVEFELFQVVNGQNTFEDAIKNEDEQIVKSIIGASLTMEKSGFAGGGFALGNIHEKTKQVFIEDLMGDVAEVFNEQIICPLVDGEFVVDAYPRLKFVDPEDTIRIAQAADVASLTKVGFIDQEQDFDEIRERLGLSKAKYYPPRLIEAPERIAIVQPGQKATGPIADRSPQRPPQLADAEHSKGCDCANHSAPRGAFWRPLSANEVRVDMYARQVALDRGDAALMGALSPVVVKMRDSLQAYISKSVFVGGKINMDAVEKMTLMHKDKFGKALADGFDEIFLGAVKSAAGDVGNEKSLDFAAVKISAEARPPAAEMKELAKWKAAGDWKSIREWSGRKLAELQAKNTARAFWVTGVESEKILGSVKGIIYNGLDNNRTTAEIAKQVGRVFENYIARNPEVSPALASAPRLETIVRTNVTRLFSTAQRFDYQNPLTQEEFPGIEYSAILDDAVCEECEELDGSVYPADDPIWDTITPPLHFNCRCQLVPVPAVEIKEFDSTNDARDVMTRIAPEFGGTEGE